MNRLDRANRRAAWRLALASLAMFAFGYALVPLYDAFCEVTGLGGKIPGQATLEGPLPGVDTTRNVKVELVATLNGAMPWEFKALQDRGPARDT